MFNAYTANQMNGKLKYVDMFRQISIYFRLLWCFVLGGKRVPSIQNLFCCLVQIRINSNFAVN